ncbi:alpha/beta fold hydrolase [Sphingobacterium bambusae]|uniref:Alpha/beta fold hydrolase n=1 Tax=Sphingobacterium bambusae TaxID=662858 RepID=A0ABW6BKP9_9SPHI|nr:alpha/beta hydrolase [Sphingobacterium bambusae]WPL47972.1 alpha/beta hydrolase [Sphingobacterium bambusae]
MRIFKRIVKVIGITLIVLLFIGICYEQISQIYFNSKKPDEASFVDIDGVKTFFIQKGVGGPTVVFQSGMGGDHKIWEQIQDSISKFSSTIAYDKSGLQWSGATAAPKTLTSMTEELEQLLEKTNCPKPYILVGHSLAGITLRPFIRKHQQDIAAVIFLDVSHPKQIERSSEELKKYLIVPPIWLVGTLVETGLARSYFSINPFIADLPADHAMNKHIVDYFYRSYKTVLQEGRDDDAMFIEAAQIDSFADIPLAIVTGAYPQGANFLGDGSLGDEYLAIHRSGQEDLLHLSSRSKQVIAKNSAHYVPLTDEKLVIQLIKGYLDEIQLKQQDNKGG